MGVKDKKIEIAFGEDGAGLCLKDGLNPGKFHSYFGAQTARMLLR